MVVEVWAPVPEDRRYEISTHGRIRNIRNRDLILKLDMSHPRGYARYTLNQGGPNQKRWSIHRLVAAVFIGEPTGPLVRHLDGNPGNNRIENLAYGDHRQNAIDSVGHGTHWESNKTHCKRGHEFTDDNTYRSPSRPEKRTCRACQRIWDTTRRKRAGRS